MSSNQQLFEATKTGDVGRVQKLLANGADPNYRDIFDGTTPLHTAVTNGDLSTTKLLIDSGADVNHRENNVGSTPLGMAALTGNLQIVRLLVESGGRLGDDETEIVDEVRELGLADIVSTLEQAAAN